MAELITSSVWQTITAAAKATKAPSFAASAYFGAGADSLLPLRPESSLVVDASIPTVQQGATCPASLIRMQKKGVRIFSAQHLHAKMYAFEKSAFVGSCNASSHSANILIEGAVRLKKETEIAQVRNFIQALCLTELSGSDLSKLQESYRPPQLPKMPAKQSFLSTLVMELLQEQGGPRASQVQPPRAVWESYLGLKWLTPPYPQLSLTNEVTGVTTMRPVVEHDHNMTIEIAGAELPRPAILQLRRTGEHTYNYRVHRPGTAAFATLRNLLDTVHNPLRSHGRDWFLM